MVPVNVYVRMHVCVWLPYLWMTCLFVVRSVDCEKWVLIAILQQVSYKTEDMPIVVCVGCRSCMKMSSMIVERGVCSVVLVLQIARTTPPLHQQRWW